MHKLDIKLWTAAIRFRIYLDAANNNDNLFGCRFQSNLVLHSAVQFSLSLPQQQRLQALKQL